MILRVPLRQGESVGLWRLSEPHEERFDVADETMSGDMDPAFFLTKTRNFIPHEYPCRREFARLHRGKRPTPSLRFEPARWWFSFEGGGVDLSGFWFRPTRIECWAETGIEASEAQVARFRFATCGGAILLVNEEEVTFLARYQRNLEEAVEVETELKAGINSVAVWFGDLCERDTRFSFDLALTEGRGLNVAAPVGIPSSEAEEIARLLGGMRFERPSFTTGDVALVFPKPVTRDTAAIVEISGDLLPSETTEGQSTLKRGEHRLVVGPVEAFPAGFHRFAVTLRRCAFALSRTLATEVGDSQLTDAPAASIGDRAHEALAYVAGRGVPGAETALARLVLGHDGAETDAMLAACLPAIVDCHDCADFSLVPLLWCRAAFAGEIGPEMLERIDAAILGFRYWMDEPGNDVMWYFSENHALLFHSACYLAGAMFPDATFVRSGRSGREQSAVGRRRILDWFEHFERDELAEWNSAPYFPIDFKGLATLAALAPDGNIRLRAARAIRRLLEIVALSSHQGMLTASQGRSYEHSLRPSRTLELSAIARLFFGRGWACAHVQALPLLALLIRDQGFRIDLRIVDLAIWRGDDALEWTYRQGPGGMAALYHYKTRDYAMGTVAAYRPGEWGYQETVLHLRLGERPESQLWINHPGERIVSGSARPSYWGGCGMLPRVHQYRALAVVDFEAKPGQVDFTHAWLPEAEIDEVVRSGNRVLVRGGEALALIIGSGPLECVGEGPTAGCEVRQAGMRTRWIVRLSGAQEEGNLAAFEQRLAALSATDAGGGEIWLDDPDYGRVVCQPDGAIFAEGRKLDPSTWTHSGQALRLPQGEPFAIPSQDR